MKICFTLAAICAATFATAQTGIGTLSPTDQLHTTGTVRFQGYSGVGSRLLLIDSSGRLQSTGGGPVSTVSPAAAIPDNGCATGNGLTSTISISGQPSTIAAAKIAVRINITHPVDGELSVFLVAPNGSVLRLIEGNGGSSQNFTNTVLSDEASTAITGTSINGFKGLYTPKGIIATSCLLGGTVNSFGGIGGGSIIPNGNWSLKIFDNANGNTGILNSWDISFSGPLSFKTVEENNYIPVMSAGGLVASKLYQQPNNGFLGLIQHPPAIHCRLMLQVPASFRMIILTGYRSGPIPPRLRAGCRLIPIIRWYSRPPTAACRCN